jgi:hypothetical protein
MIMVLILLINIFSITLSATSDKQTNFPGLDFLLYCRIAGAIAGGQPAGWTGEGRHRRGTLPARRPPARLFMCRQHVNTQKNIRQMTNKVIKLRQAVQNGSNKMTEATEMYRISAFKDGHNYCLEIYTPFSRQFHVFPTYAGCREYLDHYLWHLRMSHKTYQIDSEVIE